MGAEAEEVVVPSGYAWKIEFQSYVSYWEHRQVISPNPKIRLITKVCKE